MLPNAKISLYPVAASASAAALRPRVTYAPELGRLMHVYGDARNVNVETVATVENYLRYYLLNIVRAWLFVIQMPRHPLFVNLQLVGARDATKLRSAPRMSVDDIAFVVCACVCDSWDGDKWIRRYMGV